MTEIKDLLKQLNDEQIKPVLATEDAVLVIAGAGSGKTRVLTTRIAYLVMEKGISPRNILAITFTNKAAGEMKERLTKLIGDVGDMWVSTIHSMCVRILRRFIEKIGYERNFTIYDETDKDKALKLVFEELGLDPDKYLKAAKSIISKAKNECLDPEEFCKEYTHMHAVDVYTDVYKRYQFFLERNNSLDFDDLLVKVDELFRRFPEVVEYYADRFHYIHIDEFQDTNKVQFRIIEKLASKHGNLFVVGDDDQSIYGWRGAKIENILKFDTLFPSAQVFKLERNYRSTKKILQLANCIIANNQGRREKELWTENSDGAKIEVFVGTDENNEAAYVAMQIKSLMAYNNGLDYKDFAVFMRVNAISRAFEQEFTKYGIPYRIFGGVKFFERKEIKDVLAYLKLINNPRDNVAFLRSVVCPRRGIGERSLEELQEFASSIDASIYESIDRIDETGINNATKNRLTNYKRLIDGFIFEASGRCASSLMRHVLEATSFLNQYAEKTEENESRKMNIGELLNSAEEFEKINPGSTLADYLNSITLSTDIDEINSDNSVTVATIHASKGLEYKCVFVAGLDEKILPLARCIEDESELEEERRLMYVAVTRAMERLYLTRAMSRYLYGSREFMRESRFLKEGRPVLGGVQQPRQGSSNTSKAAYDSYGRSRSDWGRTDIEDREPSGGASGYSSAYARSMLNSGKRTPTVKKADYAGYKSGVKVKHTKFGEGTVIVVRGSGDNIIADVAFKGVGIKALSIKYAPMEIIK